MRLELRLTELTDRGCELLRLVGCGAGDAEEEEADATLLTFINKE